MSSDWIITIPKTITWFDYMDEVEHARKNFLTLNYRMSYKPKVNYGDRCFIVHDGFIRGWMLIKGAVEQEQFTCQTTGRVWKKGFYVQRFGKFNNVMKIPMQGFRGMRKFDSSQLDKYVRDANSVLNISQ